MMEICDVCNRMFSSGFNLKRHKNSIHSAGEVARSQKEKSDNYVCLASECDKRSFSRHAHLIDHLSNVHDIHMNIETFTLSTMEEFLVWKRKIEKDHNIKYNYYNAHNKAKYYLCHRSNRSKKTVPDKHRVRQPRTKGSCKLPFKCTSQLKIVKNESDGRFTVEWVKTHYGHNVDIKHLPLPALDRMAIAEKLRSGETPDNILRSVNQNLTKEDQRIDFLTKNDIRNIRIAYKIDAVKDGTHCVSLEKEKSGEFQEKLLELQNCAPSYSADDDTHKKIIKHLKIAINLALPAKHGSDPVLPAVSKKTPNQRIRFRSNQRKRKAPDSYSADMPKKGRIQQMEMLTSDKNTCKHVNVRR